MNANLVKIGEWGFGDSRGSGWIYAAPENADAVRAAYDAIEDGDLGPDVLDEIYRAGGIFVRD